MMLSKNLEKSEIKRILVISLSNLGDVILTFPVIDILRKDFPSANLSVLVGPKAISLLEGNPNLTNTYIFDKHGLIRDQISLMLNLRKERYDLVVDLRNTAIPLLIAARHRTALRKTSSRNMHMKEKHLNCLRTVFGFKDESKDNFALFISDADRQFFEKMVKVHLKAGEKFVAIGAGSVDSKKRWSKDGFAAVADKLVEGHRLRIVFVGDQSDSEIAQEITKKMNHGAINLCGQTTLTQLAEILSRSMLVIANDSAVMHMASYLNKPTLAIFGPSDPEKYGPWGKQGFAVKKDIFCPACNNQGQPDNHECMKSITPNDVLEIVNISSGEVTFNMP